MDKYQTVRYDNNRYSVPRRWAFETVTVKAYPFRIEIVADGQRIVSHRRSYGSGQQILDPLHYLATLGRRPAALDHSNVYRNWHLPAEFTELRALLEQRHGGLAGCRQYIRVLQLLAEHPLERVRRAIGRCRRKCLFDSELIRQEVERLALNETAASQPLELPADNPDVHLQVPRPDLSRFNQLLVSGEPNDV